MKINGIEYTTRDIIRESALFCMFISLFSMIAFLGGFFIRLGWLVASNII